MLLKQKKQAEQVLQKSLTLSSQSGYTYGQAQALLTLSDLQNYYNHPLAVRTAQQALTLWQILDDKPGIARTCAQLGDYYLAQNLLPESMQNYDRALALWRELNDVPAQAGALIMLGFIEHRKGEWSHSIALHLEAQRLLDEKAEPYMMGQIATALAEIFNENGLPELALTHYQRAFDYYTLAKDPNAIAYVTWGLGVTYYQLANYPAAIARFEQALASVDDDPLEAQCYEYLGRVYLATGALDLAFQQLQAALAIYTQAVNPKEAAQVRGLLGQLSERQGQDGQARRYYRQALATFGSLSDRVNQAAVYYALGKLELKHQNLDTAEGYLRHSVDVTENMRRIPTSSDLTAAFSARVYERYVKYIECLMRQHEQHPTRGFAVRAFETSELARARSLSELLRTMQTTLAPGLDPQLAAREKLLRQSLRAKEDYRVTLLSQEKYPRTELAELNDEVARLEADYQQVTAAIRAHYPAFAQVTQPLGWDLQRIKEQVVADDQTVLLEYVLGTEESYVWVVTRDDIRNYHLPAQADINAAAEKVYKALATRPGNNTTDEVTPAAQELGRMVLSPVAAELNKHRVIVVADGVLNYIPFQVLPISPLSNEPLVTGHEISNAPSATILGELRQEAAQRQPATKMLAAFGNPMFASDSAQRPDAGLGDQLAAVQPLATARWHQAERDIELTGDSFAPANLRRLFYAKRELANLRDMTAGSESFVAEEFDATRGRLIGMDLTQYAILHIATHGLLDPEHPEHSGLVLSTIDSRGRAQNGFVGLQDVYSLRAPVNLVVLSACRTGLGKDVRGEGLLGLTRGFMYAGATSVVASLWKVDDEATAELMKQFYANLLQKGMTPVAALSAAQNRIRQMPTWHAPYYWAAFTLQGEYRQVIKSAPATSLPLWYRKMLLTVAALTLLTGGMQCYSWRRLRTAPKGA